MVAHKELFELLDSLGIVHETFEHEPAFTVEQAHEICSHLPPFGPCKNLFLKDKNNNLWLIVALFDTKIALRDLAKRLPAPELRFGHEQLLMDVLELTPGSVTPFGLINDQDHKVTVILDPELFKHQRIGVHPLRNDATTLLSPVDLERFIKSCGNQIVML